MNCESFEDNLYSNLESFYNGQFTSLFELTDSNNQSLIPQFLKEKKHYNLIGLYTDLKIETKKITVDSTIYNVLLVDKIIPLIVTKNKTGACFLRLKDKDLCQLLWKEVDIKEEVSFYLSEEKSFKRAIYWLLDFSSEDKIRYISESDNFSNRKLLNLNYIAKEQRNKLIHIYKYMASKGDTSSMIELGSFYEASDTVFGYNLPDDYTPSTSIKWYKEAAERGSTFAMYKVAQHYEDGIGVVQNLKEALSWYEKIYEQTPYFAILKIAEFHKLGKGCSLNSDLANKYYEEAFTIAKKNQFVASGIAMGYKLGINGFPKDTDASIFWYEILDSLGSPVARHYIEELEKQ